MKHLIDKEKFMAELFPSYKPDDKDMVNILALEMQPVIWRDVIKALSKHTKKMVDKPHYPSGMDRDKINTRNELLEELRNE